MRAETCFVADTPGGPYHGGDILCTDIGFSRNGIAQGGPVETPDQRWYLMVFQDHGAVGKMPVLVPMEWKDGYPVADPDAAVLALPDSDAKCKPLYASNSLRSLPLNELWQWNHEPHGDLWSVSPHGLRLRTDRIVSGLERSVNTLTQSVYGCRSRLSWRLSLRI